VLRDVKNRTGDVTSQIVAVLLVALFNLPGLIVYLVIRPQATMADAYERSLEAEAILHELQLTANSCQNCHRPIDDDFNICPHCKTVLREACRTCGRPIRTSWAACPYCASDRVPALLLFACYNFFIRNCCRGLIFLSIPTPKTESWLIILIEVYLQYCTFDSVLY
jgi:RNA polymerase subunit RPABC4/transcription elongation factor Spt4